MYIRTYNGLYVQAVPGGNLTATQKVPNAHSAFAVHLVEPEQNPDKDEVITNHNSTPTPNSMSTTDVHMQRFTCGRGITARYDVNCERWM